MLANSVSGQATFASKLAPTSLQAFIQTGFTHKYF